MRNEYSWALDQNYIAHYGVAADENPPGRGSGRYPKGSGAKNGFRKITDAAVRLKKFFQKDRVNKPKEDEKLDEDELFGLVKKSLTDEFSDTEKSRMYDLLQKKYGKVTSMSDLDIEFQNARHDLAEREKSQADSDGDRWSPDSYKLSELHKMKEEDPRIDFAYKNDEEYRKLNDKAERLREQINKEETNRNTSGPKLTDEQLAALVKEEEDTYHASKDRLNKVIANEDKRDHEAARKTALDSGDRNEIAKYFNESSYGELQQALQKAELRDKLNESLAKAYKEAHPEPPQQKIPTAEEQRKEYVKQELWSGDLNRIMAVASDKSINEDELKKAINKADQVQILNSKLNPTVTEKVSKVWDKGVDAYNKLASIYNTAATINNQFNTDKKMMILPTKNNLTPNQPKQQNNNPQPQNNQPKQNQQQAQQNQQKQNPQSQNNQPKSNPQSQQTQSTQKQQQVNEIMGWLNTDTLKSPQNEKFYQNTIANIVDKPISSQSKTIEFTPQNTNSSSNTTDVKWLKMTIDPSVLNRKL